MNLKWYRLEIVKRGVLFDAVYPEKMLYEEAKIQAVSMARKGFWLDDSFHSPYGISKIRLVKVIDDE